MTNSLVESAKKYTQNLLQVCKDYPYHNPEHSISVLDRATYIAMAESVGNEDLEDLQLACLFHDTGFSEQYEKNEHIGARIARKWLEEQGHNKDRIAKIEKIIMATVLFSTPRTHLEMIIQDADLDNIGTKAEFVTSQKYLTELRTVGGKDISDCAYWQFVYKLLTKYKFHTETGKSERHEQLLLDVEHMEKYLSMIGCEVPNIEPDSMHEV
ncbi:HD domain-containing protein [Candidatus Gracilibacteria bacterium]|nr:HD domain-containing protein [Candidatus Gracilibacteria bacterium]